MAANDEEKKIPSTAANAIRRVLKGAAESSIQRRHQTAFAFMVGIV